MAYMRKICVTLFLFNIIVVSAFSMASASEQLDDASAKALVQPFYDYLSSKLPSKEGFDNMAAKWRSYSSDTQFRNIAETTAAIDGLRANVAPDLEWQIHDVIVGDNQIVIRGKGRGTPSADFFGVPASGNSFAIMSIDVHAVLDGVVVATWHVENWVDAIRQLSDK